MENELSEMKEFKVFTKRAFRLSKEILRLLLGLNRSLKKKEKSIADCGCINKLSIVRDQSDDSWKICLGFNRANLKSPHLPISREA